MDVHKIDWSAIPWTPVRQGVERKAFSGDGATVALHRLMPKHEPRPHSHSLRADRLHPRRARSVST